MILDELSPVIQAATGFTPFKHGLPDRPDTAIALIPGPSPARSSNADVVGNQLRAST